MTRVHIAAAAVLAVAVSTSPGFAADENGSFLGGVGEAVGGLFKGRELERVEQLQPSASAQPYDVALFEGYLTLSRTEYDEGDYRDSDAFARRAEVAATGQRFEPEAISARDLPTELLNEASENRRRLLVAQVRGIRDMMPDWASEAQLSYDCWMQEQEEDFQVDDIADCRERFDLAMEKIDVRLNPTRIPEPKNPLERLVVEVFFDFDSAELTSQTREMIDAFAFFVPAYLNPVVSVIGNADQAGETDYNVELSQRRADAVAAVLTEAGVEIDAIFARGDQAPAVDRLDRAPERLNRRVLLIVREE